MLIRFSENRIRVPRDDTNPTLFLLFDERTPKRLESEIREDGRRRGRDKSRDKEELGARRGVRRAFIGDPGETATPRGSERPPLRIGEADANSRRH